MTIAARYGTAFEEMEEIETPSGHEGHAWHLYILRLNLDRLEIDRSKFIEEMRARVVGCSVHFIPIPLHAYYKEVLEMRDPRTRALGEYPRLVSLPLHSRMSDEDVSRVIDAVRGVVRQNKTKRSVAMAGGRSACAEGSIDEAGV